MLTIKQVLECVRQGDWLTSIDLKDAYFHVLIQNPQTLALSEPLNFGDQVSVPPSAVRLLPGSSYFPPMRGHSPGESTQGRVEDTVLLGRPADPSPVQGGVNNSHSRASVTYRDWGLP